MGVGQELTNGLKRVGHVFSFMLKQNKIPPPPHINNDRSLTKGKDGEDSFYCYNIQHWTLHQPTQQPVIVKKKFKIKPSNDRILQRAYYLRFISTKFILVTIFKYSNEVTFLARLLVVP